MLCPNYCYPWETKRASEGWYQLFQSFSAASGEVNVASDLKKCCILLKTKRIDQVLRIDFQKVINMKEGNSQKSFKGLELSIIEKLN
ncbi:unnamed protein product [Camellia sinensis]